jgi:hypothetical protein
MRAQKTHEADSGSTQEPAARKGAPGKGVPPSGDTGKGQLRGGDVSSSAPARPDTAIAGGTPARAGAFAGAEMTASRGIGAAAAPDRRSTRLRDSSMMAHLLDALESGTDIGRYGRLIFAITARYFMSEDELVELLSDQPQMNEARARALVLQVKEKGYSPPSRARILEWQSRQEFPICPDPSDPDCGNVYRELRFPEGVYEHIDDYWVDKAEHQEP